MKKLLMMLIIITPFIFTNAQRIGELAPDAKPIEFPPNSWGVDIIFGEGGFGLGTFLRYDFHRDFTGFIDFSVTESKEEREFQQYDWYTGQYVVRNKKNRVFILPVNLGFQLRLFSNSLGEGLRPYISIGTGPAFVVTTPYLKDFFVAFGDAEARLAAGGYLGIGANIGSAASRLVSINVRYSYAYIFGGGVETLNNTYRKELGQFYITLSLGIIY